MNKTTLALLLGTGLTLSLAPTAHAAPTATDTIQTLSTQSLSSAAFNGLFQPITSDPTLSQPSLSPFSFAGMPADQSAGKIESQVFKGTGAAAGLYAYAYQVAVNSTNDGTGDPVHVDSASFKFNATPVGSDLNHTGAKAYGYVVSDGQVGGLNMPGGQAPTTLSWQPGQTSGFIRAQYVDPTASAHAIGAGTNSSTFVLLSTQAPSSTFMPSVNVGGASATSTVPLVYAPNGGTIEPVPVPEPATLLAWAGMAGAVAMVRRFRKTRLAVA